MAEEKKLKKPRGVARLIPGKCIACGARCQSSCPKDAIEMDEKGEPRINPEKCIGCQKCFKVCPAEAIETYYTPAELEILAKIKEQERAAGTAVAVSETEEEIQEQAGLAEMKEYKGVWVFVEQTMGKPAQVSWELLGVGIDLAEILKVELSAIVIGDKVEDLARQAIEYCANNVYLVDDPIFHYYRTEAYNAAICYLVNKYKPEIVLVGATGLGRDLAGAVATRLRTGLTADCTGLGIDERGFLLQTRPAFGGNVLATILTERTRPQMATVRPHVMTMPAKSCVRTGKIIRESLSLNESDFLVKVLEVIDESRGSLDVDVSAADIIVSGGRGVQSKENFKVLEDLAKELGGVVGCSRGTVEAGWMPVERQIGQTGKTVRPKIYFACGISGAIQHLVGMQDSDKIIAVNIDPHAPIFEVATYGIVGDLMQVVPAITSRVKELRARKRE
jgi:electron transfer flavoprotein alpha subunit